MANLNNGILDDIGAKAAQVTPGHLAVLRAAIRRHVPDDTDRAVVLDMLGLTPPAVTTQGARTWRHVECPWCKAPPLADCWGAGKTIRKPHRGRVELAALTFEGTIGAGS